MNGYHRSLPVSLNVLAHLLVFSLIWTAFLPVFYIINSGPPAALVIFAAAGFFIAWRALRNLQRGARDKKKHDQNRDLQSAFAQAIINQPTWNPGSDYPVSAEQAAVTSAVVELAHILLYRINPFSQVSQEVNDWLIDPDSKLIAATINFIAAVNSGGSGTGYPAEELADILIEAGFIPISPRSNLSSSNTSALRLYMGGLVYALRQGATLPEPPENILPAQEP